MPATFKRYFGVLAFRLHFQIRSAIRRACRRIFKKATRAKNEKRLRKPVLMEAVVIVSRSRSGISNRYCNLDSKLAQEGTAVKRHYPVLI